MKKVILNYLEKTGKKSEFDLFLNIFKSIPKTKFAVIKISGKTLENKIDQIAEDIAYLNKLGIYPIIIHGAGSTLDRKLPQSKKIEGIRRYGDGLFEINIVSINASLPPIIDDAGEFIQQDIRTDLVLDYLKHPDLSFDLSMVCQSKKILVVASGKKLRVKGTLTPPT